MNRRNDWTFTLFSLACLAFTVLLGKSYESTLPASDAATHAALAMSATAQGWLPHFPIGSDAFGGHWGEGYNDYPFAFFYLSGWIMRVFGPSAWSAKLLPVFFSVGTVVLTAILGMLWQSRLAGVFAAIILLFTRDFILDAVNCHLDSVLAFFILLSILLWDRKRPFWAAVAAGVGTWFKSPVALLVYPVIFLVALIRRDLGVTLRKLLPSFLLAVAVSFLIWIPPGVHGGWNLVSDYWVRQVWGTAVGGRGGEQSRDLFAFFRILQERYLPWTLFLLWGIYFAFHRRKWRYPGVLIPFISGGVVVALISCMRYKHDHYFVPAYPFLSIIAARPAAALLVRLEYSLARVLSGVALALAVFLLCTPISLSPESFPALRKYMALIQTYGICSDRVLFVDGGQPYGGPKDYKNLVNFYTGRQMDVAECSTASEAATRAETAWVLIFGENVDRCLTPEVRKRFTSFYTFGDQYLLSTRIPTSDRVELAPLERELQAATDCRPQPYSTDRYHRF